MAEDNSLFAKLPPEVVGQILAQLPLEDRLESRCVCRRWDGVGTLGLKFLVHISDETIGASMNCSQRVETLYARDLRKPLPLSCRRRVIRNFDHLQRMFFGPNLTASNMKKLLEQVQGVHTLGFSYEQPPTFKGLQFLNLTCLQFQKFQINPGEEGGRMAQASLKKLLSSTKFPALRRFNLVQVEVSDYRLYLAVYVFVANHAGTLKNLILNIGAVSDVRAGPVDARFRSFHEASEQYQDVCRRIGDVALETLWISACNYESESPWDLGCKLVQAQKGLECLLLDGIWFHRAIEVTHALDMESVLQRNAGTLTRLKLPLTHLNGNILRNCALLEEIGFYIAFEQLKAFRLAGLEGQVRNLGVIPPTLRMVDMHIPMDFVEVKALLVTAPGLEDLVLEGRKEEFWLVENFLELWTFPNLTSFRSYTRLEFSEAIQLHQYIQETGGIRGGAEFNSSKFSLVDVSLDREHYRPCQAQNPPAVASE